MIHHDNATDRVEVIKRCYSIEDLAERPACACAAPAAPGRPLPPARGDDARPSPSTPTRTATTASAAARAATSSAWRSRWRAIAGPRRGASARRAPSWPATLPATLIDRAPAPPPALTERAAAILTAVAAAYAAELARARALLAGLDAAGARDPAARRERIADAGLAGADAGLAYLRDRGVPDAASAAAGVGWCEGDALAALAGRHGWSAAELVELGLLRPDGDEAQVGRVVVPEVRDGRCVWLSGRRIAPGGAKYLGVRLPRRALGWRRSPARAGSSSSKGRSTTWSGSAGACRSWRWAAWGWRRPTWPACAPPPTSRCCSTPTTPAGPRPPACARCSARAPASSGRPPRPRTWPTWRSCPTAGNACWRRCPHRSDDGDR